MPDITLPDSPEESGFPVLPPDEDATLTRLHRDLATRAGDLVEVAYTTVDSPLGPLLLAATPRGLVRVAFDVEGHDSVLAAMAARLSPRILRDPARLDGAARELAEYFDGRRRDFGLALDLTLSTGFRRTVQEWLPHIGYGQTRSYRELAEAVGRPTAVRAVGTACATNPLPVVVPCHRVLRSDGTLGGYLGGLDAKRLLLDLERSAA